MKGLEFKTDISSECCVRQLAHYFSDTSIKCWSVDINNPLHFLTVNQENVTAEEVISIVRKAGFEITAINRFLDSVIGSSKELYN